jgi:hypothetical protein
MIVRPSTPRRPSSVARRPSVVVVHGPSVVVVRGPSSSSSVSSVRRRRPSSVVVLLTSTLPGYFEEDIYRLYTAHIYKYAYIYIYMIALRPPEIYLSIKDKEAPIGGGRRQKGISSILNKS